MTSSQAAGPSRTAVARRRARAAARWTVRPLRRIWPRSADAALGFVSLLVVALALLTFWPTVTVQASHLATNNKVVAYLYGMLNPFRTRHALLESGLPVYDLRIASRNLVRLEAVAQEAAKVGYMSEDQRLWVPATFITEGQRYNVQVRLRGDLPNHWTEPKKSWRINFGSEEITDALGTRKEAIPFHGRDQINLVIANDRDFALAPFVNDLMRGEGLVVPRDQFVVLRINGRPQGLYYEVEHFDNPLFAAYERPETTVFGQNDRAMHFEQYTKLGAAGAADARFDPASLRRLVDETNDLGLPAMEVLETHELDPTPDNFRRARAVLDWEKYLAFRSLTTLLNTNHVRFGSDNLRLYFDPSRGLLEPVPWDAHVVRMPAEPGTIDYWNNHGADELQKATLRDPELRLQRNQILWRWLSDGGEGLMARYDAIHERVRRAAWVDVLTSPIQAFKMDALRGDLRYNVRRAHKVLALSSANAVYRLLAADRAALDVSSLNFSGVNLAGITLTDPAVLRGRYRLLEDLDGNGVADPGEPTVAVAQADAGTVHFDVNDPILPEVEYRGDIIGDRYWEFMDTLEGRRHYLVLGRLADEPRDPSPLDAAGHRGHGLQRRHRRGHALRRRGRRGQRTGGHGGHPGLRCLGSLRSGRAGTKRGRFPGGPPSLLAQPNAAGGGRAGRDGDPHRHRHRAQIRPVGAAGRYGRHHGPGGHPPGLRRPAQPGLGRGTGEGPRRRQRAAVEDVRGGAPSGAGGGALYPLLGRRPGPGERHAVHRRLRGA